MEEEKAAGGVGGDGGISQVQARVAYAMVRQRRPVEEILAQEGISDEEFIRWVRRGSFSEYAASLAKGFAEADAPYIWSSLTDMAKKGSVPAIKLYFDIWNRKSTGRGTVDGETEALRLDLFGEDEE